jgi:branched-chain amino acid transport system ATP-binding protein
MPTSDALLALEDVSVNYGHVQAVRNVSLRVDGTDIVALLGANGAGKSSLLRAISGLVSVAGGTIAVGGAVVSGRAPHRISRAGVAHVPEGRRVVAPMSVQDNLVLAAFASKRTMRNEVADRLDEVYAIFPRLKERRGQVSGLMSGGEQQMLAIGRGIMASPKVLLLDEPSMGLAPIVIEEIYELLRNRQGTLAKVGILLAEQSSALALSIATHAYVLSVGEVVYDGPAEKLDERTMLEAYLGVAATS